MQYEDVPGSNVSGAGPSKMVKKWRLHFAKPPSTAEAMAVKPVPTPLLAERLELDEETVSILCLFFSFFGYTLIRNPQRRSIDECVIIYLFFFEREYV